MQGDVRGRAHLPGRQRLAGQRAAGRPADPVRRDGGAELEAAAGLGRPNRDVPVPERRGRDQPLVAAVGQPGPRQDRRAATAGRAAGVYQAAPSKPASPVTRNEVPTSTEPAAPATMSRGSSCSAGVLDCVRPGGSRTQSAPLVLRHTCTATLPSGPR